MNGRDDEDEDDSPSSAGGEQDEEEEELEEDQPNLGFNLLFGNLGSDNEVEADWLDEDARQTLKGLGRNSNLQGLELSNDLAAGQAQAEQDPLPSSTAAEPSDIIDIPSDEDNEDIGRAEPVCLQPVAPAPVASNLVLGGMQGLPGLLSATPSASLPEEDDYDADDAPPQSASLPRPADIPLSGMLAIPQSQLPDLVSATLQLPSVAPPSSVSFASQQQQQQHRFDKTPIITPSLAPSTQLLFAPGSLPTLKPSVSHTQLQPITAAEPIEIIGIDDDADDIMDDFGSEQERSEDEDSKLEAKSAAEAHAQIVAEQRQRAAVLAQEQQTRAEAVGMTLPILAEGTGDIVLRFTEMFAPPPSEVGECQQRELSAVHQLERRERILMAASAASKAPGLRTDSHLDEAGILRSQNAAGIVPSDDGLRSLDTVDIDQAGGEAEPGRKLGREASYQSSALRRGKAGRDDKMMGPPAPVLRPLGLKFVSLDEDCFSAAHQQEWEAQIDWDEAGEGAEPAASSQSSATTGANVEPTTGTGVLQQNEAISAGSKPLAAAITEVVLEQLPSRAKQKPQKGRQQSSAQTLLHPQMLRLGHANRDRQGPQALQAVPQTAKGEICTAPRQLQPAVTGFQVLRRFNPSLAAAGWVDSIAWDGRLVPLPLELTMNDPQLTFEMLRGHEPAGFYPSSATVLPAPPKLRPVLSHMVGHGEAQALLARFNTSQDNTYRSRSKQKATGNGSLTQVSRHAVPASSFSTISMGGALSHEELLHRPRGHWAPPAPAAFRTKGLQIKISGLSGPAVVVSSIVLKSLVGMNVQDNLSIALKEVDITTMKPADVWAQALNTRFGRGLEGAPVPLFYHCSSMPYVLRDGVTLAAGMSSDAHSSGEMSIAAVFTKLQLLSTWDIRARMPDPSAGMPTKAPQAFQKKRDLTPTDGSIHILEYFQEAPLLLSRPGMGVRLATYYRKRSPTDSAHQKLFNEDEKWRTGLIQTLEPEDEPVFLGDIRPGMHQLAVGSNMFKAPACAYHPRASDFLLIRQPSGALLLREMNGYVAVGQQEPLMRIPAPSTKDVRDIEEKALEAWATRELRNQKNRWNTGKQTYTPRLPEQQLKAMFPSLTSAIIRRVLKDPNFCDLGKVTGIQGDTYVLRENINIQPEANLRKLMSPDRWCTLEAMWAGEARLRTLGCHQPAALAAVAPDRMRLIHRMLHQDQGTQKSLQLLNEAVATTPWALSEGYLSATARETGAANIELTGVGDPSGSGRGYSFIKASSSRRGNTATSGSSAEDLRRLSGKKAAAMLKEYGLSEAEIAGMTRWEKTRTVQEFAAAAAEDAQGGSGSKSQSLQAITRPTTKRKEDLLQRQQQRRRTQQHIFDKQVEFLSRPESADSDMMASESDIHSEGTAVSELHSKDGGEETSSRPQKGKKGKLKTIAEDPDETEEEAQRILEELQGTLDPGKQAAGTPATAPVPAPKLEAAVGARRLRRTIITRKEDGSQESREIILDQLDQVYTLNSLYTEGKEAQGWGTFGYRHIKGKPLEAPIKLRLSSPNKGLLTVSKRPCGRSGHKPGSAKCVGPDAMDTDAEDQQMPERPSSPRPSGIKVRLSAGPAQQQLAQQPSALLASPSGKLKVLLGGKGSLKRQATADSLGEPSAKRLRPDEGLLESPAPVVQLRAPPKKAPAKKGAPKKAPMSARKSLNSHVLMPIMAKIREQVKQINPDYLKWFKQKVGPNIKDYHEWVQPSDVTHLAKIDLNLRRGSYTSSAAFRADFAQILANAESYNTPGNGKLGFPAVIPAAQVLLKACDDQLAQRIDTVQEADHKVQQDASGLLSIPSAGDSQHAAASMVQWVECSRCHKWRAVGPEVYETTVAAQPDSPWFCEDDFEKPEASCADPQDPSVPS
ncbi:hypothetical protein WJX74_004352 [Apatococcus lobatus]|uniref:CW-type domain-containing protein n=1 Tax=Apatococcus lobatus TaxID=904363 RepID=A0AAW1Q8R4_9CHLO